MAEKNRSRLALTLASTAVAVVWCVVLPWVSNRPSVQQRIQFLDERGIDASAMFYTELDAMVPILKKLEGR
ncbi:MAG: hypothetical protein WAO83_24780 [Fuerstiella sp.]